MSTKAAIGLLDRVTGKRKKQEAENARAREMAAQRDQAQKQALETAQAQRRTALLQREAQNRMMRDANIKELGKDIERLTPHIAPKHGAVPVREPPSSPETNRNARNHPRGPRFER